MAVGVSPLHTSVPADDRRAAKGGTRHIVAGAPGPALERLLASRAHAGAQPVELLCVGAAPSGEAGFAADVERLEALVRERLADARVGVRLHVAGSDALVRRVTAVGLAAGLLIDEIGVACDSAQPAYRVACVHCQTITEPVETTIVRCAGCERTLFVYHHYSPRKAAYMGFKADAEVAGEAPEARSGVPCP